MSEHYRQRLRQLQSLLEPGLRRMFLLSLVLHLIVPIILSGVLKITHKTPKLPVYRVNLVNKPVKNPRAGRPDAAPKAEKKKPVKKVAAKKVPAKPTKTVKAAPPKKTPAVKKVVPEKKPLAPAKPDTSAQEALQKRLAAMAAMQEEVERKRRLEELKASLAAQQEEVGKPVDAPVGEPDGSGDEIGISDIRFVEGFIKEQWRLSEYQLPRLDLEAEVKVVYTAEGKMRHWEFVEKSGNALFDDSLRRAVLKSRQLNHPLPADGTFEIVFNLKDLQNR